MQTSSSLFSENMYDKLKFVAQVLLPALATLVFGFTELWELPYGLKFVGTITLVDTFLGVLLGISNIQYKRGITRGEIVINEAEETAKLALNSGDLYGKHSARLDIRKVSPTS